MAKVMQQTGLSRSTIYLYISQGYFPKPISLGARAVGWISSEIEQWVAGRIAISRPTGAESHHDIFQNAKNGEGRGAPRKASNEVRGERVQ